MDIGIKFGSTWNELSVSFKLTRKAIDLAVKCSVAEIGGWASWDVTGIHAGVTAAIVLKKEG